LAKQKEKVGVLLGIVNIVITATNLAKTFANTSYSLLEYLHGMEEAGFQIPLAPLYFSSDIIVFLKNHLAEIKSKYFIIYC